MQLEGGNHTNNATVCFLSLFQRTNSLFPLIETTQPQATATEALLWIAISLLSNYCLWNYSRDNIDNFEESLIVSSSMKTLTVKLIK